MAERLDLLEVARVVSPVVQAECIGASVALILRVRAEQRPEVRFQRAETLAMEVSMRVAPRLVAFTCPAIFIILVFPIVTKFLGQQLL
jgi:tight adherence protein C